MPECCWSTFWPASSARVKEVIIFNSRLQPCKKEYLHWLYFSSTKNKSKSQKKSRNALNVLCSSPSHPPPPQSLSLSLPLSLPPSLSLSLSFLDIFAPQTRLNIFFLFFKPSHGPNWKVWFLNTTVCVCRRAHACVCVTWACRQGDTRCQALLFFPFCRPPPSFYTIPSLPFLRSCLLHSLPSPLHVFRRPPFLPTLVALFPGPTSGSPGPGTHCFSL